MNRRSFVETVLLAPIAALAALATLLQACGSDYNTTTGSACDGAAPAVGVAEGHTHSACVTKATLTDAAANGTGYTLVLEAGYTGHTHTFTLSAADLAILNGGTGTRPSGSSSAAGSPAHSHAVTF